MNLAEHIYKRYDLDTAEAVEDYFSHMDLPLPGDGEYTQTFDAGQLVFLNFYACVIRLNAHQRVQSNNPWILNPLASHFAGRITADINPGIHSPADRRDMYWLRQQLKKDDIILWDWHRSNGGYLPTGDSEKSVVMVDPGAIGPLPYWKKPMQHAIDLLRHIQLKRYLHRLEHEPASSAACLYTPPSAKPRQDELYGQIRSIFNDQSSASPDTLREHFWASCLDLKKRGNLVTDWLTPAMRQSGLKNIYAGSKKYASHFTDSILTPGP